MTAYWQGKDASREDTPGHSSFPSIPQTLALLEALWKGQSLAT